MRKILAAVALTVTLVATTAPTPASAVPSTLTSNEFAQKCSSGVLTLDDDLRVTGAHGTLVGNCVVLLGADATLTFWRASIDGPHSLVVLDSLRRSRIIVRDSTIDVGGAVQFAAGCCGGGDDPGDPYDHGTTVVRDSFVRGSTVEVSGSNAADHGTARVMRTHIEATSGSDTAVFIVASLSGRDGSVFVSDSMLVSAGGALVATSLQGTTVVQRTTFAVAGTTTIRTAADGTCRSINNTPLVPCT